MHGQIEEAKLIASTQVQELTAEQNRLTSDKKTEECDVVNLSDIGVNANEKKGDDLVEEQIYHQSKESVRINNLLRSSMRKQPLFYEHEVKP